MLACGADGAGVVELAALDGSATGWDIHPLLPRVLEEIDAPQLDLDDAALMVGAVIELVRPKGLPGECNIVRILAGLAGRLDYPGGIIADCFRVEEFLDCDCHPGAKAYADVLEDKLRHGVLVSITPALAGTLVEGVN